MRTYPFHQIDVFTERPLTGNALAVFPDAVGLEAPEMQALAREMNLSETTFVFPSERATRRVRFLHASSRDPSGRAPDDRNMVDPGRTWPTGCSG
jgi:trans-2,3-dihydro-3-hydroxyanthranilate isomerase